MAIAVLMATYNGERFVKEQLESLLRQSYGDLVIFVRDDGSTDNTRSVLASVAAKENRVRVLDETENLGVSQNFFRLLDFAGAEFDYYAFCDQDDVWLESKLQDAATALDKKSSGIPQLYFTRLNVADESLAVIGQSPVPKVLSFENAISQNVVTGCTALINRAARELILKTPASDPRLWAHDWWLYLVISRFGQLTYNPNPGILYRQHAQNLMGSKQSPLAQLVDRVRSASGVKFEKRRPSKLISLFLEVYGAELEPQERKFLSRAADASQGFLGHLRTALSTRWKRQSLWDTWVLRLRIVLGQY